MQYEYSWDILLCHNIVPWTLTFLAHISAVQRIVGQKSMLACTLHNTTGCSRTSLYFWHSAYDICIEDILNLFLAYTKWYGSMGIGTHSQWCWGANVEQIRSRVLNSKCNLGCTDTGSDTQLPILTQIAGSGIGDNGADLFNSILCLYTIYIIYWNLNSCLSFDQFVATLKKVYTWIVIPVNFEDFFLPSCWCTIYYFNNK